MNYGKPEDDKLPIHEQVRQSCAALCGMVPLITDESTARCVETNWGEWVQDFKKLVTERDDLARRCADLENERDQWRAKHSSLTMQVEYMQQEYEGRGVGVRLPAAGVPQSDYDRLLESYHVANRLARELRTALESARAEIESLKAQDIRHPAAPADPPHGTPAALGDCVTAADWAEKMARECSLGELQARRAADYPNVSFRLLSGPEVYWSDVIAAAERLQRPLPEPARLNESIPGSAALHDARPVSAKPAPGPIPLRALRFSR